MPAKSPRAPIVVNGCLMPPATREYSVLVIRHGGRFEFFPPKPWRANLRIRAFAHTMFVKYFGRQPDRRSRNWHKDGFMAECCDRRGNCVQIEQTNWGDPRYRDGTWGGAKPSTPAPAAPLLMLTWSEERRAS